MATRDLGFYGDKAVSHKLEHPLGTNHPLALEIVFYLEFQFSLTRFRLPCDRQSAQRLRVRDSAVADVQQLQGFGGVITPVLVRGQVAQMLLHRVAVFAGQFAKKMYSDLHLVKPTAAYRGIWR